MRVEYMDIYFHVDHADDTCYMTTEELWTDRFAGEEEYRYWKDWDTGDVYDTYGYIGSEYVSIQNLEQVFGSRAVKL